MPRPRSKASLLAEIQKEHTALESILASLTPEQMVQGGIMGEWSIKDLIAHLYEWEQLLLYWIAASQRGESPNLPKEGYQWSQLAALNEAIRKKHLARPLDEVLSSHRTSYDDVMSKIESLSEENLFTAGLYPWLKKDTLAIYVSECTGNHYRWARTEIRRGLRAKRAQM